MNPQLVKSHKAAGAIAGSRIVKFSAPETATTVVQATGAGEAFAGVSDSVGVASGGMADVVYAGLAEVRLGGTVKAGDRLTADEDGKAVVAGARAVVGYALAPGVEDDIVPILVAVAPAVPRRALVQARVATLVGSGTYWTVSPVAGRVTKVWSVTEGALTVGNATLTAKINGTGMTTGVITVTQAGSAAGDVDSAEPSALNAVAIGDRLAVTVGGTNETASAANVLFEIEQA